MWVYIFGYLKFIIDRNIWWWTEKVISAQGSSSVYKTWFISSEYFFISRKSMSYIMKISFRRYLLFAYLHSKIKKRKQKVDLNVPWMSRILIAISRIIFIFQLSHKLGKDILYYVFKFQKLQHVKTFMPYSSSFCGGKLTDVKIRYKLQ